MGEAPMSLFRGEPREPRRPPARLTLGAPGRATCLRPTRGPLQGRSRGRARACPVARADDSTDAAG
eukprot:8227002-Alexandrium_andersonii.AAC.1